VIVGEDPVKNGDGWEVILWLVASIPGVELTAKYAAF
jgi:hypothetical protein